MPSLNRARSLRSTPPYAFTLSETLIALAIIGIIAAICIPVIITGIHKNATAEKVKKTYSALRQVVGRSTADNGHWENLLPQTASAQNSKNFTDKYIKPYYLNLEYCSGGLDASQKCGLPVSAWGANYITGDGIGLAITIMYPEVYILADTNNSSKPNEIGRDVFYFKINNNGDVLPFGYKEGITREQIKNGYNSTFFNQTGNETSSKISCNNSSGRYSKYACTYKLMLDGWEFKNDYPW